MLSNNRLCLRVAAQCMLLFLVLGVKSNQFRILRSYMFLFYAHSCVLLWLAIVSTLTLSSTTFTN